MCLIEIENYDSTDRLVELRSQMESHRLIMLAQAGQSIRSHRSERTRIEAFANQA